MLMQNEEPIAGRVHPACMNGLGASGEAVQGGDSSIRQSSLKRALRIEWLGQMGASICWIASVLCYGISSSGDWLQLCAASSWLLANIAAAVTAKAD